MPHALRLLPVWIEGHQQLPAVAREDAHVMAPSRNRNVSHPLVNQRAGAFKIEIYQDTVSRLTLAAVASNGVPVIQMHWPL
jgi:hypothetical protein